MTRRNDTERNDEAFSDDLALLVDGDPEATERHADLLTMSDEHRDARHEAKQVAARVADAAADYEHPANFSQQVLESIDQRAAAEADAKEGEGTGAANVDSANATSKDVKPNSPVIGGATGRSPDREKDQPNRRLYWTVGGIAALAATVLLAVGGGGVFLWLSQMGVTGREVTTVGSSGDSLYGTIARVARAADDEESGIEIRRPGSEQFASVDLGGEVPAGSVLRTDARTRVELLLSEGSRLSLNHDTEVVFASTSERTVEVRQGEIVADIAHIEDGPRAEFETPTGRVTVLGTKFVLTAAADASTVRVARGKVRVVGSDGAEGDVSAGQEGILPAEGAISVSPTSGLAQAVAWSEIGEVDDKADTSIRGVGELRARRPGEQQDRERPLTLSEHKSTVRIVGNVARTEIEETFSNDSRTTLEGIYRFPLPPDARIASLQLLVDGKWEEGAFVERNRAQRIWRGVIRNATPEVARRPQEEFIWVPGPWRDPALLEWQRGGHFELRIFPIPARGSRSVRIAYTQTITPHGAHRRRYVHPLSHSSDESTRIGRFEVDVRIAGHEGEVRSHGYQLAESDEAHAKRLRFSAENFLPAGDLLIDYQLRDAEIRYWTFQGDATVAPPENTRNRNDSVNQAQRAIDGDTRPYVVFALKPELPAWNRTEARDYAIVVDSSQSMTGALYERATELVGTVVREMDRRDRFQILACDATCQTMGSSFEVPSGQAAERAKSWLRLIEPAGSSDLSRSIAEAVRAGGRGDRSENRRLQVLYVGDGIASVGPRRLASLRGEMETLVEGRSDVAISTVGIGGDADTRSLSAIAQAGRGHYTPYVPGQRVTSAALAVLESTYGTSLTDAHVVLPDGVTDVVPSRLPTLRAGQEILIAARLTGEGIRGNVQLSGKVAGRVFEQEYPVALEVSTSRGNAFVPRQWASTKIEELELNGMGENEAEIVALSKAFGVMSRHTSLLVLESEAMFRAFRVDRGQPTIQWTGDEDTEVGESEGLNQFAGGRVDSLLGSLGTVGRGSGAASGSRFGGPADDALAGFDGRSLGEADEEQSFRDRAPAAAPAQEPPQERAGAQPRRSASGKPTARRMRRRAPMRNQRLMRREWYRVGSVSTDGSTRSSLASRVTAADAALRENPDSRDRHRDLVRALSAAGELERALEVVESWMERDRLDPEALIHKADLLGRQGRKDEAVRWLSGIVDLQPDDRSLQERLADAFDRQGAADRACQHRVSIAELRAGEISSGGTSRRRAQGGVAAATGAALRCARALGRSASAERLLATLPNDRTRQAAESASSGLERATDSRQG